MKTTYFRVKRACQLRRFGLTSLNHSKLNARGGRSGTDSVNSFDRDRIRLPMDEAIEDVQFITIASLLHHPSIFRLRRVSGQTVQNPVILLGRKNTSWLQTKYLNSIYVSFNIANTNLCIHESHIGIY